MASSLVSPIQLGRGVDIPWHNIIISLELESGVDISWHNIIIIMELKSGCGYIAALYIHPHGNREYGGYGVALHIHSLVLWHYILWHYIHSHGIRHGVKHQHS